MLPKTIVVDGITYIQESSMKRLGEVITISQVRPIYGKSAYLDLRLTTMPVTKFRPGMKIRVTVESESGNNF